MPYTTYIFEYSIVEEDYGQVNFRIAVSDEIEGLYAETGPECNILVPGEINKALEDYEGRHYRDEFVFGLDESAIEDDDDYNAAEFIKAALNSGHKRYCAVFINPSATPLSSEMKFCGMIMPEAEAKDIRWSGSQYGTDTSPARLYSFYAKSLIEELFDLIALKSLIYGESPDVPGLDSVWEAANVEDKPGWFLKDDRTVAVHQLVNLNILLRGLADNLAAALDSLGYGSFDIVFDRSEVVGKFIPARWSHIDYNGSYPRYVYSKETMDVSPNAYQLYADDAASLYIDPDGAANDYEAVWLNYSLVKPDDSYEINASEAEDFALENISTFTEFICNLAEQFGIYPKFYFSDSDTINIAFINCQASGSGQVYLTDALEAEITVSGLPVPASKLYTGKAFYLANNGNDFYIANTGVSPVSFLPSPDYNTGSGRRKIFLTLSPTQCSIDGPAYDDGNNFSGARIPHNHYFIDDSAELDNEYSKALSLHTGIYMFVDKRAGAVNENDSYFTPAAKFIIEMDGEECEFDTLSNYLNILKKRDEGYFAAEYMLIVPGFCGFSADSSGAAPDWGLIKPGVKVSLTGIDYYVAAEQLNFTDSVTVLYLHSSGRFDNLQSVSPGSIGPPHPVINQQYSSDKHLRIHEAYIPIDSGNLVSLRDDGAIEKSMPTKSHYGRIYGIALNGADEGENVKVQTGNRVCIEGWGLVPGAKYYLRLSDTGIENISMQALIEKNDDEELYALAGIAESASTLNISNAFTHQYLFE